LEEDGPDRSGHQRKKKLGDKAKGHTVIMGIVDPKIVCLMHTTQYVFILLNKINYNKDT